MPMIDNLLLFAGTMQASGGITPQSVNGAGTVVSSNVVDNGPTPANQVPDYGRGEEVEITIAVITAPTVGTSVQFQLVQADDAAISSNVQVLAQTDAFPIANLPAGTRVPLHWRRADPFAPKRYVALRFVNVGAIATASYIAAVGKDFMDTVATRVFRTGYSVI